MEVFAFLDESALPVKNSTRGSLGFLYASGLVYVEGRNTLEVIQSEYELLFRTLKNSAVIRSDRRREREFLRRGFHVADDDQSLSDRLRDFIEEQISLRYHYRFSFVPTDLSDDHKKRVYLMLHKKNVEAVLEKIRGSELNSPGQTKQVSFIFEEFSGLNSRFKSVVFDNVANKFREANAPAFEVHIEKKSPENGFLAIADSFVTSFSRIVAENILECKDLRACDLHCLSYDKRKAEYYDQFGHVGPRSLRYRDFLRFRTGLASAVEIRLDKF